MARRVLDSADRMSVVGSYNECFGLLEAAMPKRKEVRKVPTIHAAKLNLHGDTGSWQSVSTDAFAMRDGE